MCLSPFAAASAVSLVVVAPSSAIAQSFTFRALVTEGDALADGSVVSFLERAFDVNNTGTVAWTAGLSGTPGGTQDNRVLATSQLAGGPAAQVARGGSADLTGGPVLFAAPRINDAGQIVVETSRRLNGSFVGRVARYDSAGSFTTILDNDDPAFDGSGAVIPDFVHRSFGPEGVGLATYDIDNAGNVAVRSTLAGSGGQILDDAVSYYREGSGEPARTILREDRSFVGVGAGSLTYAATRGIETFADGSIGINAGLSSGVGLGRTALRLTPSANGSADPASTGFDARVLSASGDPLGPGRFIAGVFDTNWLSSGSAVANIEISETLGATSGTDAYAILSDAGTEIVLEVGDASPDGGAFELLTGSLDATDDGLMVFVGRSDLGSNAIYAMNLLTSEITEIISQGDAIFGGTLSSIHDLAVDSDNQLVFAGAFRDGGPSIDFLATVDLAPLIPAPGTAISAALGLAWAGRRRR